MYIFQTRYMGWSDSFSLIRNAYFPRYGNYKTTGIYFWCGEFTDGWIREQCNLTSRFTNVFVQGLNLAKNRPTSLIWTDYKQETRVIGTQVWWIRRIGELNYSSRFQEILKQFTLVGTCIVMNRDQASKIRCVFAFLMCLSFFESTLFI